MDLLTLNCKASYNNFMAALKNNADKLVDKWYTMGAVTTEIGTKRNWHFINGGKQLDYEINWGRNQPDGAKDNLCLTMYNGRDFIFQDSPCSGKVKYGFFCQKSTIGLPRVRI